MTTAPLISVRNVQRRTRIHLSELQGAAERALREVLKLRNITATELRALDQISVVFVSDARMAELHRQFLNERGPTDVITFDHGEIIISVDTARRNARRFGNSLARELQLYFIHGLLHLHGFTDQTAREARRMSGVQERILLKLAR